MYCVGSGFRIYFLGLNPRALRAATVVGGRAFGPRIEINEKFWTEGIGFVAQGSRLRFRF